MSSSSYVPLVVFAAGALVFPLALLGVARAWALYWKTSRPNPSKGSVYECGLAPADDGRIQFKAHYYLYAILFLIFDVEVLFLLPFACAFTGLGAAPLIAILAFILLLGEGLVWAWHRGFLDWQ